MDDIIELLVIMATIAVGCVVILGCITVPISYFDGQAKSAWIKQTRGIDMPWYQATFLSMSVSDMDARVEMKPSK